jgi:hypothetical protein
MEADEKTRVRGVSREALNWAEPKETDATMGRVA